MSCPECGSPEGSLAQLCSPCVARKKQARQEAFEGMRGQYYSPKSKKTGQVTYKVSSSKLLQLALLLVCIPIAFFAFSIWGPVRGFGVGAIFVFSIYWLATVFGFLTYFWLWVKMITYQPFMGILGIVIPPAVWYWAKSNPELARGIRIAHFAAVVVAVVSAITLSKIIHKPYADVLEFGYKFALSADQIYSSRHSNSHFYGSPEN